MLRTSAVPFVLLAHLVTACSTDIPTDAAAAGDADEGPGGAVAVGDVAPRPIAPPEESPVACGGVDCTKLPHVDPSRVTCQQGQCQVARACAPGWGHCGNDPTTGCETDLTATASCGACSVQCGGPTPLCVPEEGGAARCVSSCEGTRTPTACGNTCVDTQNDPLHCGGCAPCGVTLNGSATCSGGLCGLACNPGFHRCGSTCREDTSVTACGPSCATCAAPPHNGVAACVAGACTVACDAGFYADGGTCKPTYTVSGAAANVVAFDVDSAGGMLAVARGTGELRFQCFSPNGIPMGPDQQLTSFDAATTAPGRVMVARSRVTKQSLVLWHVSGPSAHEAHYAYVSASCQIQKSAPLATTGGNIYLQGVAIDDQGLGAALLNLAGPKVRELVQFDKSGAPLSVNDFEAFGAYDSHLAMRRTTGETIIVTSTYVAPKFERHYRRFSGAGAAIDPEFIAINGLLGSGSYVRVGMDDDGAFVVLGEMTRIPNAWGATFHNATGAVVATLPAAGMAGYADTFVPVTSSGDFVWPIRTAGAATRERRSAAGVLVGASPWGTPYANTLELRLDANDSTYMILGGGTGRTVKKDPFAL